MEQCKYCHGTGIICENCYYPKNLCECSNSDDEYKESVCDECNGKKEVEEGYRYPWSDIEDSNRKLLEERGIFLK